MTYRKTNFNRIANCRRAATVALNDSRIRALSALLAATMSTSCSQSSSCTELADPTGELFGSVQTVAEFAVDAGMPIQESQAAFVVGSAKALYDLQESRVQVCLRVGSDGTVEFLTLARGHTKMEQWKDLPNTR